MVMEEGVATREVRRFPPRMTSFQNAAMPMIIARKPPDTDHLENTYLAEVFTLETERVLGVSKFPHLKGLIP